MTQPSRWHVARFARLTAVFGVALLFGAGHLAAQGTTGKIEGTVRDQAGAPVAGAQVLIVGSAFASTSNEQGYYFINNVPAGVMTLRAQYIGYAPSEVTNVRVFAGQTMTVNLRLEQRAIEVTGINVTVGATPLVPRDQVSSKPIVAGELVQALGVSTVTDIISTMPGVVQSARGLSIRGGRVGEAIIYLDGVPMRSVSGRTGTGSLAPNGGLGVNVVGTDALEEISVTTGAIGASQGDAQSGVISYLTRSGGQRFSAYLRGESDEIGGQSHGQGLDRLEGSLSGPLAQNLTFFASTVMEGRQSALLGMGTENAPLYALNGIDTTVTVPVTPGSATSDSTRVALPAFTRYSTGMRRPDNWSNDWNFDSKLTYTYGSGSRVSASFHRTRSQGLNFRGTGQGGGIYDPQSQSGYLNTSNVGVVNWSQQISRSPEHALTLDAAFSIQSDNSTAGLVDQNWFQNNHTETGNFAFGNIPFVVNTSNFALDDRLIQNVRMGSCRAGRDATRPDMGGCIPFIDRVTDLATASPYRANPYGAPASPTLGYPTQGTGNPGVALAQETRTTGRVSVDWQANRYNRVNFGGDFVRADVRTFNAGLTDLINLDAAAYKPNRFGLYGNDRVDLGDVVIDFGLRYDRLNSNTLFPRIPGEVFADPLRNGTAGLAKLTGILTSAGQGAPSATDSLVAARCQAAITAADTASLSTCNMFPAQAHSVLLPSVRVSFPVTDRTGFRLSYAQQAQTPDFARYASSVNTDLSVSNTNRIWGQDISYGKTILFEFGIRHAFSQDMVLDISAFNKDKVSDVTARVVPYFNTITGTTQAINLYTNQDFGNVRGVDFKLDRRIGSLLQGSLSYTFEQAKSTGSDPTEYINTYARQISAITGDREPPPQAILTTGDNRTHTISGAFALNLPQGWNQGTALGSIFQGFGAFATFRFASGLAYTPFSLAPSGGGCINIGNGGVGPNNGFGLSGTPCAPLNANTTPWYKNVDLRLTRAFQFSTGRNVTVFADFRNLFNFTNLVNLFVETGDVVNSVYQDKQVGPGSTAYTNLLSEVGAAGPRVNGTATYTGWDLSNCAALTPNNAQAAIPDCIMLRRVITRFAGADDPDLATNDCNTGVAGHTCILTTSAINRSFTAWYNRYTGPYTLYGPPMTFRLGFEFNF